VSDVTLNPDMGAWELHELYREVADTHPTIKAGVAYLLGGIDNQAFRDATTTQLDGVKALLEAVIEAWSAGHGILFEDTPGVMKELNRLRYRAEAQRILDAERAGDRPDLRSRLVRGVELADLPEPGWLIDGVLPGESLTLAYGPKGHGKSFVTVDMAMSITHGRPWAGRQVRQGPVIYVIGEGASGMHKRQEAWLEHHANANGAGATHPVIWLPWRVNLMDDHQVSELVDIVAAEQPLVVFIDTLNRCSPGADENSPRDMGQLVAALDRIRDVGATAVPVHHAGKDLSKGARGHTALLGAADAVLKITGGDRRIRLENEWQKDAEPAEPIAFRMIDVARSVVLQAYDAGVSAPESVGTVLNALRDIDSGDGVSATNWMAGCEDMSRPTFFRAKKFLVTTGQVENVGTVARPKFRVVEVSEDGETVGVS
jgi:AAA domain